MAKKKKIARIKSPKKPVTVTATQLKGAMSKMGLRLPHGYAITKRKRK